MRTIIRNIATFALIASVGVSTAMVASADTNAYLTVTANMTTPNIAVAMVKNNTGTKRYSTIQIGNNSSMGKVYTEKNASLNGGESINVSLENAKKYDRLYARGIVYKEWNPHSGVASQLVVKIK